MGKSKTKNQKKSRAAANHVAEETYGAVPHSFVFHRGQVGKNVGQLILDTRKVMEPYTAESLKMKKKNVLKDFVAIAGPLGVSHFIIFSKSPSSLNMRLARLPKGPMLHFRVLKYSLVKDVVSSLKKHRMHEQQFTHHPLLILNNFGSDGMHVKLMATMFQNMFPSINVHKVNLNNIKRCVLLNYNPASEEIELRHYSLKVVPVGMSRGVKKLMQERFPNMNKFEDISELLIKGANLSESEAEQDGEHNITELPQAYSGRGNMASQQSAVRLTEIGPRLTLQLVKIQEGMGEGNVLHHAVISKTEEEIQQILNRKEAQLKEKASRRKKQERNVAEKNEKREENKKKSLEGMKKLAEAEEDSEVEDPGTQQERAAAVESDDEAEYYRQAVGQEPDEDMFSANKRRRTDTSQRPFKKRKMSPGKPPKTDRNAQSAKRRGPERPQHKSGKGWKQVKDDKKPFGKKKTFGGKKSGGGGRFGGKRDEEKSFKPRGQKAKPGFKKKGAGAKQGFKQRKGKAKFWMMHNFSDCETFQMTLLPYVYGAEFVVALAGNLFALWLLLVRERRSWHTGVVLSCNLAISDLLYVLTLPLLIAYYSRGKRWMFGDFVCQMERFLFTCNLYASIFFIMAISINRCVALACPFFTRSHVQPVHAKVFSVLIWIAVAVISCPVLKFASACAHNNKTLCVSFCDEADERPHLTYRVFLAAFGCFGPFLVTFTSYCVVIWVVWKNTNITTLEKRKVALLVASVVALYAVSFMPYHVFQIYHLHLKIHGNDSVCWVYNAYQVSKGLAALNMCVHPILYMAVFDSMRVACCGKSSEDSRREMEKRGCCSTTVF
ncbi:suppressor of SWI4 1 homolog [Brachionichthys hirsutus]|uniref:suppressor of SWI4 1 homolog n=1 Tax=Brachionichthys hirsutus TaxID=412623 RepID=UPI0036047772